MTRLVFKIQGMDCPEEVAVLRRAVGPVVGGTDRMSCDLLNGTMTVSLPEGTANPDPIMQAVLWLPPERRLRDGHARGDPGCAVAGRGGYRWPRMGASGAGDGRTRAGARTERG